MKSETQRQTVLAALRQAPLTTLEARNELFIMGIAARIFELKAMGYPIASYRIPASFGGKRMIAQYVLLSGDQSW